MVMTWDVAYEKFIKLIVFAAHKEYNKSERYFSDNSVTPDDLVQIGMIKLMECLEKYPNATDEEFKAVFQKALFRAIKRSMKTAALTDDIETTVSAALNSDDDNGEDLFYNEGLSSLFSELKSPIAKAILHELVEPSPRTLWEAWADKARKQCVHDQGKKGNLAKSDEVRLKHIKASLGITQKQVDLGLVEIREKAKRIFAIAE